MTLREQCRPAVCVALLAVALACSSWPADPVLAEESRLSVTDIRDLDGDGLLSFDEFVDGVAKETVESADADHDLFLSPSEIRAPEKREAEENATTLSFADVDTNRDGKLDAAEIEKAAAKDRRLRLLFDTLDKDHDDKLSRQERRSAPGLGVLRIDW